MSSRHRPPASNANVEEAYAYTAVFAVHICTGPHPTAIFEVNTFSPHQTGALFGFLTVFRGPCSYVCLSYVHPLSRSTGLVCRVSRLVMIVASFTAVYTVDDKTTQGGTIEMLHLCQLIAQGQGRYRCSTRHRYRLAEIAQCGSRLVCFVQYRSRLFPLVDTQQLLLIFIRCSQCPDTSQHG